MKHLRKHTERKIFGGFNFVVVLWTLLSIFRLSVILNENSLTEVLSTDILTVIIPLLFLAVLNVLMGISLFFPQKKNHLWILSLVIVVATLSTLNAFQLKLTDFETDNSKSIIVEF